MTPRRLMQGDDCAPVLALIRDSFAGMDGRIDPPTSMHRLTLADIEAQAATGEVWLIGSPPLACIFLTPRGDQLHVSKLAVAASARRQGHARTLLDRAETRGRALGLSALQLQTRVELVENHAAFAALGFVEVARTAHPGFDRPTSVTMARRL